MAGAANPRSAARADGPGPGAARARLGLGSSLSERRAQLPLRRTRRFPGSLRRVNAAGAAVRPPQQTVTRGLHRADSLQTPFSAERTDRQLRGTAALR